jgi:pimeloyl-ACP methyl ester carboxylesterase
MTETFVDVNGVRLCVETVGRASDPVVLLIHGACASMRWWDRELCELLAASGRFVVRYDQRDTGRSTTCPAGSPDYSMADLARDAVGILDAIGVSRAHVVGRSMGGGVALTLGVDHRDRVATLTFVGSTTGDPGLPPIGGDFPGPPDFADPLAVTEHIVEVLRVYAGPGQPFDETRIRDLAAADVEQSCDIEATMTNHFLIDLDGPVHGGWGDVVAPTLVVHGAQDPVFSLEHGEAVARAVPGSTLLVLSGTGHDIPRAQWPTFVAAVAAHTGR